MTARAYSERRSQSAVHFTIGPDGVATDVTIDWLNEVGLGTLRRVAE